MNKRSISNQTNKILIKNIQEYEKLLLALSLKPTESELLRKLFLQNLLTQFENAKSRKRTCHTPMCVFYIPNTVWRDNMSADYKNHSCLWYVLTVLALALATFLRSAR